MRQPSTWLRPGLWWLLGALSGCTAIDVTALPTGRPGDVFVTQESVKEPYDSLGVVQVTRRGVLLFGFIDPAGTDLVAAVGELVPEIRRAGADGAMNVRIDMTQYNVAAKLAGLLFFFAPFPSEVTITGELVKLKRSTVPVPVPVPVAPL